ncbi:unnamed protein product [Cercopithifilaria johnstoni]|uniref:Uncharacterized protein n=1 Tax=Cercopithifilaria johnstoni TaxID=2874296 RepID=A0A8J2M6F0_9BILA|nr:unnamed protein product [Cercopithifilaria johnstoni]
MSDVDLQERLARHRGFTIKAREVLLEPPAPFAVVTDTSGNSSDEFSNPKLAHRGFTAKAREMLVERQTHDNTHSSKSFFEVIRPDFDICHNKQQSHSNHAILDNLPVQQANIGYEKKEILVPHSKLSRIKAHKLLGETGKTRSANEIFYDQCMKRVRNPSLRCDLLSAGSSNGNLAVGCPDSQRSDTSETAKMIYTTFSEIQLNVDEKEENQ